MIAPRPGIPIRRRAGEVHRVEPKRVFLVAFGWPMLCLAGVTVATVVLEGRTPDPLATHWTANGPDGSMSRAAFFSLTVGTGALIATAGLVAALASSHFYGERVAMVSASAVGTFFAGLASTSLWANVDAPSWESARALGTWSMLGVVVATVVAGGVAWWCCGPIPRPEPADVPWVAGERLGAGAGDHEAGAPPGWEGGTRVHWPLWLAVALSAFAASAALAMPQLPARVTVGVCAGLGAVALVLGARLGVTVDDRAVRLSFGWIRRPGRYVPLADIVSVDPIELNPWEWGGWGVRWVPHRHATAVVLRRGEAVVIHLTDGRTLAVTVDDAAGCAAAVNALVRASRGRR